MASPYILLPRVNENFNGPYDGTFMLYNMIPLMFYYDNRGVYNGVLNRLHCFSMMYLKDNVKCYGICYKKK